MAVSASSTERTLDPELHPGVDETEDAGTGQQPHHPAPIFVHHRQLVHLALLEELQRALQWILGPHRGQLRVSGHDVRHAGAGPLVAGQALDVGQRHDAGQPAIVVLHQERTALATHQPLVDELGHRLVG
jgi:hypothetical protein